MPPITLDEAILRARVAVRQRQKRGAKFVVASVAILLLPLIAVLAPIFPSETGRSPSGDAYLALAIVTVDFIAACLGVYWVLMGRSLAAWLVVAGGLGVGAYYAYIVAVRVVPLSGADLQGLLAAMTIPFVALVAAVLEVLGGLVARPRAVRVSEAG